MAVLIAWALPHAAQACSCVLLPAPAAALQRAEAVFEARVENAAVDVGDAGVGEMRYDLEVLRQWKGELGAAVQLSSPISEAACGRNFAVGKVYVIYASKSDDGRLTDNLCSRTRLASEADEDLAVLGPGVTPTGDRPVVQPTDREPPRITPPAPDLEGPAPIEGRGCSVFAPPTGPNAAISGLWSMLALAGLRRRR